MTVDVETLLTIIFVLVDDWYQQNGVHLLKGKRGAKPHFKYFRERLKVLIGARSN
jgi:hypothetical protein